MKKRMTIMVGILAVVLTLGGMAFGEGASSPSQGSGTSMQQGAQQGAGQAMGQRLEKLSINTATAQDLQRVPGIDQNIAQNIVDYRMANGPYNSVDDLSNVQGMDKQKIDSLRKDLTARLDLNIASADQLQRVPGVQRGLAQNIIQYREANGPFSSVDDLSRIQGIDRFKLDMMKKYVQVGGKE